ncbi:MAG: hypothetical protein IPM91_04365 [Bacteroidetes bacterium]|nr:hypothetical protein [Bacteroidota bacterium]
MRFYPGLIFLLLTATPFSLLCAQDSLYAREVIHELTSEKYHGRGYVKMATEKLQNIFPVNTNKQGFNH